MSLIVGKSSFLDPQTSALVKIRCAHGLADVQFPDMSRR